MQYQVPQFIEVEDRLFGDLTVKQFLYVAGGAGISVVLWRVLPTPINFFIIAPILGFFLALAFYKVNGRPFVLLVESAMKYAFSPRLYIWKKTERKPIKEEYIPKSQDMDTFVPKLTNSKLRDLSWGLDINKHVQSPANTPSSKTSYK